MHVKQAHEVVALEILTLLLEKPTDDSVEVAIAFLKECGQYLADVSSKGLHGVCTMLTCLSVIILVAAIFERLRSILNEGSIDKRVQYMIEVMYAVRKDGFKVQIILLLPLLHIHGQDFPTVAPGLDLVEESDQITHLIALDDVIDAEKTLDVFNLDPNYLENEEKYKEIKCVMCRSEAIVH